MTKKYKMIQNLIIVISICQICLYLILDKMTLKYGKVIIFLLILVGYFFVFPKFFLPLPDPDGIGCGMPVVAFLFTIWVVGGGSAILIHIIYYLIRKFIKVLQQ